MIEKGVVRLVLVLIILSGSIFCEEDLTLTECLKRAYRTNHLLQAADLHIISAQEQLKTSQAQRWPEISFNSMYLRVGKVSSFEYSTSPLSPPRKLSFGTPNRINLDLKLQMPLFTWWRVGNTIDLAMVRVELSQLQQEQQRLNITDQLLRAYFAVLLNNRIVDLLEQNLERTKLYLETTQKRFEAGNLPQLEVLRAQVQLSNEQSNLVTATGNQEKSKILLAKTTGAAEEKVNAVGMLSFESLQVNSTEIIHQALANHLDLKMMQKEKELTDIQIVLTGSANKPNLFFVSGYNVSNGFDPTDPERFIDNWNVGVQLSWPIFNGFETKHKLLQASIDQKISDLQEMEIREMLVVQIQQALVNLKQAEIQIQAQEKNIGLAKEALQMAVIQYEQGFISSMDLVDAQKVLLRSEISFVQAIFNHIMTKIDLSKTIGDYQWFESAIE